MLIILEGVDGAGKSTLAARLTTALARGGGRVRALHAGPPTAHPLVEYEVPLHTYRPGAGEHVVCDRWHLGEAVYPAVLGRPTSLTPEVLAHVEMFLRARGALLVHVDEPLDLLRRRVAARGDDLVRVDQLRDLQLGFHRAVAASRLRVGGTTAPDEVLVQARVQEVAHAPLADFVTYVGPRYPDLLLLGDVRNTDPAVPSPAFVTYPPGSGTYLMRALLAAGADVGRIGIANACDVDDVGRLVGVLAGPLVVPLGANARRRCERLGIPAAWTAAHPQYARRFHHHELAAYGREVLGKWS